MERSSRVEANSADEPAETANAAAAVSAHAGTSQAASKDPTSPRNDDTKRAPEPPAGGAAWATSPSRACDPTRRATREDSASALAKKERGRPTERRMLIKPRLGARTRWVKWFCGRYIALLEPAALLQMPGRRGWAYAGALLVTVLWSSSFVLIKEGLQEVPPLYFATLRYALAFAVLLALTIATGPRRAFGPSPDRRSLGLLAVAGLAGYTVAQGFQYVGLYYLPAVTTSLILTFNPLFVLMIGVAALKEKVSTAQLLGMGVALAGAWAYFSERLSWGGQWFGVLVVVASGLGWAVYLFAVRGVQRSGGMSPLGLTTATMGIGVAGMAALTAASGGFPPIGIATAEVVAWLALANTAFAFLLWNWALEAIPPYELTVLQDLMTVEIALFALAFLGEAITPLMAVGIALVVAGVAAVQLWGKK